jgi:hypothetical protein
MHSSRRFLKITDETLKIKADLEKANMSSILTSPKVFKARVKPKMCVEIRISYIIIL